MLIRNIISLQNHENTLLMKWNQIKNIHIKQESRTV